MRAIFLTQSGTLNLFFDLYRVMKAEHGLKGAGFFLADQRHFDAFLARHPGFPPAGVRLVKEWEIHAAAKARPVDPARLRELDARLGAPTLWDSLVADRRLYLGRKATFSQDYAPGRSHRELLALALTTAERLEALFDEVQPRVVVSFICVTLADHLGWLIARSRGIPFLNLRPTRLENLIYAGEDVLEPSADLARAYQAALAGPEGPEHARAREILARVRNQDALYEGVYRPSARAPEENLRRLEKPAGLLERWAARLKNLHLHHTRYRHDPHVPSFFSHFLYRRVIKPWRARMLDRRLRPGYLKPQDLAPGAYAFFPLHTEPEVTLLVYGKPWLNQIEAARLLASSLPLGMRLLVKEHPWSVGKRKPGYYRKLLAIPNLVLAPPEVPARDYLAGAALVAVIGGSVGLEALMLGRPVVTLGRAPFNFLPPGLLRHAAVPDRLGWEIRDLLAHHAPDEKALTAYLAAVVRHSCPVDLYTRLLGRPGAHALAGGAAGDPAAERQRQVARLAAYLLERLAHLEASAPVPAAAPK